MRLLILAAAATLAISGTAMAAQHHHHHHAASAQANGAPAPEGATPADTLSAHELVLRNLHDSGHNPANDFALPN
jgi:hypothetical protein